MVSASDRSRPIGVFDSGVGGLTVVRALLGRLPGENVVYFGDTARVPYGPKSPRVIREYAAEDAAVLLKHAVKMVVVACNTVSAVALDVVRKKSRVPVIGVIVPGARTAVQRSRNGRIGVIGTSGTIASGAYTNAIRQIEPGTTVTARACPLFVPLAEEGWTENPATDIIAKEYLAPFKREKIDTLVLGCTHYPVLRDVIGRTMGDGVTLVDSGDAVAAEAEQMLDDLGIRNTNSHQPNVRFFVSDVPEKFTEVGERFLGARLGKVRRAELW